MTSYSNKSNWIYIRKASSDDLLTIWKWCTYICIRLDVCRLCVIEKKERERERKKNWSLSKQRPPSSPSSSHTFSLVDYSSFALRGMSLYITYMLSYYYRRHYLFITGPSVHHVTKWFVFPCEKKEKTTLEFFLTLIYFHWSLLIVSERNSFMTQDFVLSDKRIENIFYDAFYQHNIELTHEYNPWLVSIDNDFETDLKIQFFRIN